MWHTEVEDHIQNLVQNWVMFYGVDFMLHVVSNIEIFFTFPMIIILEISLSYIISVRNADTEKSWFVSWCGPTVIMSSPSKQAVPVHEASHAPGWFEGHGRGAGGYLNFGKCGCKDLWQNYSLTNDHLIGSQVAESSSKVDNK